MIIDSITILGLNCNNCPKLIDMGLSVKWAESNIGLDIDELSVKKYGDYFAWGELNGYIWDIGDPLAGTFNIDINKESVDVPKTEGNEFNTSDYKFGFPSTAYTESGDTLNGNDDIATVLYGEGWSIPNPSQWEELFNNCNRIGLDSKNGVSGLTLTSNINGNQLFLPFIGYASAGYGNPNLGYGDYWTNTSDSSSNAIKYSFSQSSHGIESNNKWDGLAIRPVYNG